MDNDEFVRAVADKIRAARNKRKLSIRKLSAMAGLRKGAIWDIENGISCPRLLTLKNIADALEMDIKEFL